MMTKIKIELDPKELGTIIRALRAEEERHKKAGFKGLELQEQELKAKLADIIIDSELTKL